MWFPNIDDPDFYNKLYSKSEFNENTVKKSGVYQEPYQQFVRKFINQNTPYDSLLLFWALGTGKSLGSVSILENFRNLVGSDGGLEKFLIITKNETLRSVFRQEILKEPYENPYASDYDRTKLRTNDPTILKTVKNRISNKYEFINYDEFVIRVLGKTVTSELTGKQKKEKNDVLNMFDNRVIVIDEVQNITGNFRYIALMKVLKRAKNVKLVILSATPIVDTVEEMIYISNILNFKNPKFEINHEDLEINKNSDEKLEKQMKKFYKEGILEKVEIEKLETNLLSFNNLSRFTKKGETMLIDSLKGRVSHIPLDPTTFPKKIKRGSPITKRQGSVVVVKCPMSEHQTAAYRYALTLNSQFHKSASDALTMSYNSKVLSKTISRTYVNETPLEFASIGKYSSKIQAFIQNMEESNGCVFIYSNYVETSGTKLIETILKKNGYEPYSKSNDTEKNYKRYVKYSDDLSNQERLVLQNKINSKENIDGSIIKVVIGSPMISEGISFKNIRQVHILEPYWNMARTLQAEGRCIRNYSHIDLPENERVVNTFWYVSVMPNNKNTSSDERTKEMTIDELKYILCEEKDRLNKHVERILKEISIDCYNIKKIDKYNKKYFEDFTPECDYQKCEYTCRFIDPSKITELDDSTYSNVTDPQEIKWAKDLVKKWFSRAPVWDIDKMTEEIVKLGLNKYNLFFALEEMVKKEQKFYVAQRGTGHIIYSDRFYRFKPDKYKEKKETKNIEDFKKHIKTESTPVKIKEVKKGTGVNKNRLKELEKFSSGIKSPIFGIYENEKFKIVDKRQNKDRSTDREQPRGITCTSLEKTPLLELAAFSGIKIPAKTSKEGICNILFNHLKEKNLILNL